MSAGNDAKFETGKAKVVALFGRLGQTVDRYDNPNDHRGAAGESGADVIAVIGGRRIGIQVTDLDTGEAAGVARAAETMLARDAAKRGSTYFAWGQNDPLKLVAAIARSVARKARMSFSGFDESWLLICTGVPTSGAIASTFAMTPWIEVSALDAATLPDLERSKYARAFVHSILGAGDQALFDWRHGESWSISALSLPSQSQVPSFWEQIKDPELWNDADGWFDRQVERSVEEARKNIAL
jgi:hypothetical protein